MRRRPDQSDLELPTIGNPDAAARPEGLAAPCAACAVRPLAICGALDNRDMARLQAILSTTHVPANAPIFDEGEPAEFLFNVTNGVVKLYRLLADGRRQITGFLYPGDLLGLARPDATEYAYSAETVVDTQLCRFPRKAWNSLAREIPSMERRLFEIAANELAVAQDQMLLLGRKTAEERIASFLMQLSQRAKRRGAAPNPVFVPMARADIADYLGLTTETVSRTLTRLKTRGVIQLQPRNLIELSDRDALEALSEGL